ncbi:MAG: hypothetical protein IPF58_07115 [Saprospirales bacterium]|nr:hypothetical protein [Saprospirales bacterium]
MVALIFCNYATVNFADFYTEWFDNRDLSNLITTNFVLQITQPDTVKWYYFKAKYNFCLTIDSIQIRKCIKN